MYTRPRRRPAPLDPAYSTGWALAHQLLGWELLLCMCVCLILYKICTQSTPGRGGMARTKYDTEKK